MQGLQEMTVHSLIAPSILGANYPVLQLINAEVIATVADPMALPAILKPRTG